MPRYLRLSAFFMILATTVASSETVYIEGKAAKFRSGPGTNYKVLWEAPVFTPLEFLAKFKDWYAVRDKDGDVGWVHNQVIAKGKAAVVTDKKADVRKGPGKDKPMAFAVEKGYLFRVVDEKKEWAKVKDAEGDEGWILKESLWMSR
ncbi:MAG: SH3 domain-containing protein [Nitrospinae bacterium]|nr:SH3 domain-containing protein [Nitrospinota bacterium]